MKGESSFAIGQQVASSDETLRLFSALPFQCGVKVDSVSFLLSFFFLSRLRLCLLFRTDKRYLVLRFLHKESFLISLGYRSKEWRSIRGAACLTMSGW